MISCPFSSVSTGHAPIQGKGRFVKWRHWHKSTLFVNEIIRGDFMRMPLCERRSADPGRIRCCRIGGTFRGAVFVRERFYPVPFASRFPLARWGVAVIIHRIFTRLDGWSKARRSAGRGSMSRDAEFLKEVQRKFEQKLREHEINVIEHWKERLDRIYAMRPEGIAPLQLEIRKLSENMANRVSTLKKG